MATRVIQVTNIAPAATKEQMSTLFGFLGKIDDIQLYPSDDSPIPVTSRVCYVKFADPQSVGVSLHLTNTVFIDRALIVVSVSDGKIPDEVQAMMIAAPANAVAGLPTIQTNIISQDLLLEESSLSSTPDVMISSTGTGQVITTIDPRLTALGLPQYPPLPANMDPSKIEEIRRTIYVGNLDSTITAEQLLSFFSQVGEVKYVRMAGDETQPTRFAFVEFTDQTSVAPALQYNGVIFAGRPLKVNHSNNAIVKPQAKSNEAAQREIEEAMKRVREAQSLITAAIEPGLNFNFAELAGKDKKKSHSRSRSTSRRRSRSRSRHRSRSRRSSSRGRSRHRTRSRSRKRSPSRHSRSRSHEKRPRSRSRDKRSRSKSREKKHRSPTPPRSYRSVRRSRSKSSSSSHLQTSMAIPTPREKDKKTKQIERISRHKSSHKSSSRSKDKSVSKSPPPKIKSESKGSKKSSPKNERESFKEENKEEVSAEEILKEIKKEEKEEIPLIKENSGSPIKRESKSPSGFKSPILLSHSKSSRSPNNRKSSRSPSSKSRSSSVIKSSRSPNHGRKKSRTPSRKKSRSPSIKKSRSPSRKSPSRKKSRSPNHKKSRSPGHKKSRSPTRKKSRSPSRKKSRSPNRKKSRSPSRKKSRSPKRKKSLSPRKSSSSRKKSVSPNRKKSRSPKRRSSTPRHRSRTPKRRSATPKRRSRSRSRKKSRSPAPKHSSRHRKEKKKDKDRDRSRDRESKSKKKHKDKDKDRSDSEKLREAKVTRNYDEEEKGYDGSDSGGKSDPDTKKGRLPEIPLPPDDSNLQQMDMEVDSD